jgi:hypothetical protein
MSIHNGLHLLPTELWSAEKLLIVVLTTFQVNVTVGEPEWHVQFTLADNASEEHLNGASGNGGTNP